MNELEINAWMLPLRIINSSTTYGQAIIGCSEMRKKNSIPYRIVLPHNLLPTHIVSIIDFVSNRLKERVGPQNRALVKPMT